ncbi:MAG TPA: hypothetical protein VH083_10835 [Myxococcales bacterium]|nr:hypothetical protein [Myxococcales bacterium]
MRRALLLMLAAACAPDFGSPEFLVDRSRVLAIQSVPPEGLPGSSAAYRVLLAGPTGPLDASSATWALCTSPLSLTETGTVASECLGELAQAAQGAAPALSTSANACGVFGPVPSSITRRPRNPDATGGFFQPVRVQVDGLTAFAQERLQCPLTLATLAVSVDFQQRYKANQNPVIESFTGPASVAPGAQVQLTVSWPQSSAEIYPLFDPAHQQLNDTAEVLDVSWYATGGSMAQDRTTANGLSSSNTWTAPSASGTVFFWAVLHDSRGGIDFAQLQTAVGGP